jgi:hypothetical protein
MKTFSSSRSLARTSIATAIAATVAVVSGAQAQSAGGSASTANGTAAVHVNSKVPGAPAQFTHPGLLSTQADLDRMKA